MVTNRVLARSGPVRRGKSRSSPTPQPLWPIMPATAPQWEVQSGTPNDSCPHRGTGVGCLVLLGVPANAQG